MSPPSQLVAREKHNNNNSDSNNSNNSNITCTLPTEEWEASKVVLKMYTNVGVYRRF